MARISKCRGKRIKREDDEVPLPDPFPLPKHHAYSVEVALKKKKMSSADKGKFLGDVASAIFCYRRYPKYEEYLRVAMTITAKYPFLKTSDSKPYVNP